MRTTLDLARLALVGTLFFLFVPRRPEPQPVRVRADRG
jgi:hypothetical protein